MCCAVSYRTVDAVCSHWILVPEYSSKLVVGLEKVGGFPFQRHSNLSVVKRMPSSVFSFWVVDLQPWVFLYCPPSPYPVVLLSITYCNDYRSLEVAPCSTTSVCLHQSARPDLPDVRTAHPLAPRSPLPPGYIDLRRPLVAVDCLSKIYITPV